MKVDFHVHTKYSHDCSAEVGEILQYARRHGLDAIAIADHDTLEGSREARRMRTSSDVEIIPAIEFTLPGGDYGVHILALNMDEYICFKDILQAIEAMKRCGATIVLPHPFRKGTGLLYAQQQGDVSDKDVQFVLDNVDYVEALNLKDNCEAVAKTLDYAGKVDYPIISGTDAHYAEYVGMTYTETADIEEFLAWGGGGVVRAYVKSADAAEPGNLHEILETGNDAHYANRHSPHAPNNERAQRFIRCAEIAEVFRKSQAVGFAKVDNELRILCESKI